MSAAMTDPEVALLLISISIVTEPYDIESTMMLF